MPTKLNLTTLKLDLVAFTASSHKMNQPILQLPRSAQGIDRTYDNELAYHTCTNNHFTDHFPKSAGHCFQSKAQTLLVRFVVDSLCNKSTTTGHFHESKRKRHTGKSR